MAAVLLILTITAFFAAMALYVAVMARGKKPVSFFDLSKMGRSGDQLALWAYRLWVAAIVVAILFSLFLVPMGAE